MLPSGAASSLQSEAISSVIGHTAHAHCSIETSTVPFKSILLTQTAIDYAAAWAGILSFILNCLDKADEWRRFKLTDIQQTAFTALNTLITTEGSTFESKCDAIVEATYAITAGHMGNEDDSQDHPVVAYTILKNINPGNFIASPDQVAPTMAPIQYLMRSAVYLKVRQRVLASNGALTLFNAYTAEEQWLKEGKDSAFSYIRQTVHLSGFWAQQTTRMPRFKWEKRGTHFHYNGHRFSYRDFKVMLITRVDALLTSFMRLWRFFQLDDSILIAMDDIKRMKDAQDNRSTHYSFLDDPGNAEWSRHVKGILDHVIDSLDLCTRTGVTLKWHVGNVQKVLEAQEEFLGHLMTVMYLTGGQPPRGSELCHALFRNLPTRTRNIYQEMGHIANVGFLNKTSYIQNADKPIPRGFPPTVSFILANYLMFIRPIEHLLSHAINRTKTLEEIDMCHDHLFCIRGNLFRTGKLTDMLEVYTKADMGATEKIGTADMRQMLVSIAMRCVQPGKSEDYRARTDLQSGHITALARIHYGLEIGRMSPNLTQEVMDAFLQISRDHHIAFGLATAEEYTESNPLEDQEAEVSCRPHRPSTLPADPNSRGLSCFQPLSSKLGANRSHLR